MVIDGLRFPPQPSLRLRSGERTWSVAALEASRNQAVWQLPADLPAGPASLTLSNDDGESRPYGISIASRSGGLYSLNNQGWGPALAARLKPDGKRTPIDPLHPAHRGDEIALEATGSAKDFLLSLAGAIVNARWIPLAAGRAELHLEIPAGAPLGCHVPVQLRYRSGLAGNSVTLPIALAGSPCRAEKFWPAVQLTNQSPIGLLLLTRLKLRIELPGQSGLEFTDEEAAWHFFLSSADAHHPLPVEMLPPTGSCITFHGLSQQNFGLRQNLLELLRGRSPGPVMRAGPGITLQGPAGHKAIPRLAQGDGYFAFLGGERPDYSRAAQPLYLKAGDYLAESPGGEDVGPFVAPFPMPRELQARGVMQQDSIPRQRGLKVSWSGGDKDSPLYLLALSVKHSTTAFGACLCAAANGGNQFTIPPEALANLPATEIESTMPLNLVFLISAAGPVPFQARGLSSGFILPVTILGRTVDFR